MNFSSIGFMQGRLSPVIDNKIQFFPKDSWNKEFQIASKINIHKMEWTLDYEDLKVNPLLKSSGQQEINKLKKEYGIKIPSLTGDCFMQKPFWKETNKLVLKDLLNDLKDICIASNKMGIKIIVIPIVDNGAIENKTQKNNLLSLLLSSVDFFRKLNLMILFECDFEPEETSFFISQFPQDVFGINYDTGNSASLGYCCDEEFKEYGNRIKNVHIKDRLKGGSTVELTRGDADFKKIFKNLRSINYKGNLIMQTARAKDGDHEKALIKYKHMIENWIGER